MAKRRRRKNPNYGGVPWVDIAGAAVAATTDYLVVDKLVHPLAEKVPMVAHATGMKHNLIDLGEKVGVGIGEYALAGAIFGERAKKDVAYGTGVVIGGTIIGWLPFVSSVAPSFKQYAQQVLSGSGSKTPAPKGDGQQRQLTTDGQGLIPAQIQAAAGTGSPIPTAVASNSNYGL